MGLYHEAVETLNLNDAEMAEKIIIELEEDVSMLLTPVIKKESNYV